ncbi:hypothetical protein GDO86_016208 [Hymenochirus boettgeri]|uniref:Uncharacterized protein n=1 Tax=Hymenochirus boettgeri TaxID=247094 RepID=A0A8T2K240_9PIPI|nr:hypothetical protein GDO86_016208 [Hymenochirus boettgeri]
MFGAACLGKGGHDQCKTCIISAHTLSFHSDALKFYSHLQTIICLVPTAIYTIISDILSLLGIQNKTKSCIYLNGALCPCLCSF